MKNIRRTAYGWQLYTRASGRFISEHRTTEPTPQDVRTWVHAQHALAAGAVEPIEDDDDSPTLAEDVATYLSQIQTMRTLRWRRDDLTLWIAALGGNQARQAITSGMIRQQLETWRAAGYAASTVNHRRTALMHLWTVLDGKSAPNPARDVARYTEPDQPPNPLSDACIDAILAAMPDDAMKARLTLMRWTGWPQAQIRQLTAEHVQWKRAVFMTRQKGHGIKGRWIPLLPQAWSALRRFAKLKAWGEFKTDSMRGAFRRAAARAAKQPRLPKAVRKELADVTPYRLRHSFGTLISGVTQDDRAVQTLMLHADIRQTHRYTGTTVEPRAAAAVQHVGAHLQPLATKRGVSGGRKG